MAIPCSRTVKTLTIVIMVIMVMILITWPTWRQWLPLCQDVRVRVAKTKRRQRMSRVGRIRAGTARRRHRGFCAESHCRPGSRRKRRAYVMHRGGRSRCSAGIYHRFHWSPPMPSLLITQSPCGDCFIDVDDSQDIWPTSSCRIAGLEFSRDVSKLNSEFCLGLVSMVINNFTAGN